MVKRDRVGSSSAIDTRESKVRIDIKQITHLQASLARNRIMCSGTENIRRQVIPQKNRVVRRSVYFPDQILWKTVDHFRRILIVWPTR